MTGALKRWEKRPKAWTETWQCLHHDGPTRLSAELVSGGETVSLTQEWPRGAVYTDVPAPPHTWERALGSFRPFLSYAELSTMFDTLASLYDALTPVLGLEDVDVLIKQVGETRLAYDKQRKQSGSDRDALLGTLDPDDERAALVAGIISARKPDLAALAALLAGHARLRPGHAGAAAARRPARCRATRRSGPRSRRCASPSARTTTRRRPTRRRRPGWPRCSRRRSPSATATTARCAGPPACSTTPGPRARRARRPSSNSRPRRSPRPATRSTRRAATPRRSARARTRRSRAAQELRTPRGRGAGRARAAATRPGRSSPRA